MILCYLVVIGNNMKSHHTLTLRVPTAVNLVNGLKPLTFKDRPVERTRVLSDGGSEVAWCLRTHLGQCIDTVDAYCRSGAFLDSRRWLEDVGGPKVVGIGCWTSCQGITNGTTRRCHTATYRSGGDELAPKIRTS